MITKTMKKYLEAKNSETEKLSFYKQVKHCVYMKRIQNRIDRELNMLLWLAVNKPEILDDNPTPILNEYGHNIRRNKFKKNERLRKLLLTVKALNPRCDIELILNEKKVSG